MEMTKKPTAPKPSPAPFSSRAEREALEEALLPPPPPPQRSIAPQYVPTAVPIANATPSSIRSAGAAGGVDVDSFYEQGGEGEEAYEDVPIVAASVAAPLPVPPPAAAPAAASRATEARGTSTTQRGTGSEKSESCAKGEEGDDDVVVLPEPSTYDPHLHPLPTAPAVPTHESYLPSAERDVAAAGLRAANVRGGWTSREEEADVGRAMRGRGSIRRRADDGVRTANERAARQANRRDEGLTVDEGIHRLDLASGGADERGGERGEDDDVRPCGVTRADGTRGYEVKEYETSDYETTEYETTEYKSVYD